MFALKLSRPNISGGKLRVGANVPKRGFCSRPRPNEMPHPLKNWKIHPYLWDEDWMTPEELHKSRNMTWEDIKARNDEINRIVNDKMEHPEKYMQKAPPLRDIIISDASFIFNKYIPNPKDSSFSHLRVKLPEATCTAIKASWDRIFLQPLEGTCANNYFYLGREQSSNLLQEKELGKIQPGVGLIMAVDAAVVEQATDAQRKEWTYDRLLSMFPNKSIPKYNYPRLTWRQSGQKAIRSFPFALWGGEFNFVQTGLTEAIVVFSWTSPKGLTQEVDEVVALGLETHRPKLVKSEDDAEGVAFWNNHVSKPKRPWPRMLPGPYLENPKVQWDYIEGAPDQDDPQTDQYQKYSHC